VENGRIPFARKVRIIAEPSLMSAESVDEATSEERERLIPRPLAALAEKLFASGPFSLP